MSQSQGWEAGLEMTTIRLEIEATSASSFSEQIVRTVNESCSTLKFNTSEFEEW